MYVGTLVNFCIFVSFNEKRDAPANFNKKYMTCLNNFSIEFALFHTGRKTDEHEGVHSQFS